MKEIGSRHKSKMNWRIRFEEPEVSLKLLEGCSGKVQTTQGSVAARRYTAKYSNRPEYRADFKEVAACK